MGSSNEGSIEEPNKDAAPFQPGLAKTIEQQEMEKKQNEPKVTKFLALNKAIPGRRFLQLIQIDTKGNHERKKGEEAEEDKKEGSTPVEEDDQVDEVDQVGESEPRSTLESSSPDSP